MPYSYKPALPLLRRGEKCAGWIYFPFYVLLLSIMLLFGARILGFDITSEMVVLRINLIYSGINFFVLALCFRHYLLTSARQLRYFPGRFFTAVGLGLLIYLVGTGLMSALTEAISPGLENVNDQNIAQMAQQSSLEIYIFTVLFAPLSEELLFRGLIFTSIRPHSRFAAYCVSILTFSALHVLGYLGSYPLLTLVLCFVQYLPASFALAWALDYAGSIWASITVHTIVNTFATAIIMLQS